MKSIPVVLALLGVFISAGALLAQTIWTGPAITISKANFADWTLPVNQDRITNNVWITRANIQGIFNIADESGYMSFSSPSDTEWAFGTTAGLGSLTFANWETTVGGNPPGMLNQDMVVHLITDDIYIDIRFTAWTTGGLGGGFSYQRSTDNTLSAHTLYGSRISVFPNPSTDVLQITGLTGAEHYQICNIAGQEMLSGISDVYGTLDVGNLNEGMYVMRLGDGTFVRFIKRG